MLTPKYTKGPWQVMPPERYKNYIRVRGTALGGRYKIADVRECGMFPEDPADVVEETLANARLIAAAPELLEALQGLLKVGYVVPHERYPEAARAAQAAVLKATGDAKC